MGIHTRAVSCSGASSFNPLVSMRPLLATVAPGCINSIYQTTRRARLARRPLLAINLVWINGPELIQKISTRQFDLFWDFTVWSDRWCKMHIFLILELYWRFLLLTHLLSNVLSLLDNKIYESIVYKLTKMSQDLTHKVNLQQFICQWTHTKWEIL